MKFIVKNVSMRTHVVDRDIAPGATTEYSEDEFAKYAKAFASAMQSTNHLLSRGFDIGSDSVYQPGTPELEIYAEIDGDRGKMTVADVLDYSKEAAAKLVAVEADKKAADAAKKEADEKDRAEFEAWKAERAKKAEAKKATEK